MLFRHINLVVADPEISAEFYRSLLLPDAEAVWLGDSLHLRTSAGDDLAFQTGNPLRAQGAHHGFIAASVEAVDRLLSRVRARGVAVTDDCTEEGFRSIKFLDPDGYEIEVYWEAGWPDSTEHMD